MLRVELELVHIRVPAFLTPFISRSVSVGTESTVYGEIRWIYLVSSRSSLPQDCLAFRVSPLGHFSAFSPLLGREAADVIKSS